MSRVPPIAPEHLNDAQTQLHDKMTEGASQAFGDVFVVKRDDGGFVGPFASFLHLPAVGEAFFNIMAPLSKIFGLPAEARETAILAAGSHWQAKYELYAQGHLAAAKTKLSATQLDMIKSGKKPSDLDEPCNAAFDVAMELVQKPGPLSQQRWDQAEKVLGKEGTLALIHYVGYYSYTCMLLNGCDVPVPDGEKV